MSEFIDALLKPYIDDAYREFSTPIVASKKSVIGVRSKNIHQIVKDIANYYDISVLQKFDFKSVEETEIYLMLLPHYFSEEMVIKEALKIINKIDSWAETDSFVSSFKAIKKNPSIFYAELKEMLNSKNEWTVRLALVFFLSYYPLFESIDEIVQICLSHCWNEYYILMAEAWFFSVLYIKNRKIIEPYLENKTIDGELRKMTIRKCLDSYRISDDDKLHLREIR